MRKILTYFLSFTLLALVVASCSDDKKKDKEKLDFTEIKALIAECKTILEDAQGANKHLYLEEDVETFKTAIETAETFLEDNNTSYQSTITSKTNTLETAKKKFLNSALNVIQDDKALILGFNFNNDTIADVVYSNGYSKPTVNLTAGPKEIFDITGKPTYVDRATGKAMHFNKGSHLALTDYVDDDFLQTSMSFAAWVRLDELNANNYIVSYNYEKNWSLKVDEEGRAVLSFITTEDGGATTQLVVANSGDSKLIAMGEWAHIVASLDLKSEARSLTFYINGQKTAEYTDNEIPALKGTVAARYLSPLGKSLPIMVGAATTYEEAASQWSGTWNTPETWSSMRGAIDNLAIFDIAITALQVEKLYNDQK